MKTIQIDCTNTLNKGAELMLVAILEQIEKYQPNSKVFYNTASTLSNYYHESSKLDITQRNALKYSRIPKKILDLIGANSVFFTDKHPLKEIDIVLDGAGFQFSDQWNYSTKRLATLEKYYKKLKGYGTKIVLLPQAFGPFETKEGKEAVRIIDKYADMIIAREQVSYDFLKNAGCSTKKMSICTDFTLLAKGTFPSHFEKLKGQVCIIPNHKMISHTSADAEKYWSFLENLINDIRGRGLSAFLLNHEGANDLKICQTINGRFNDKLEIVSGLSAKDVKGIIGSSFITFSSRFHGVASSLNQGVPCLATSWNHKYEMLLKDFNQTDGVLSVDADWNINSEKIKKVLENHSQISNVLVERKKELTAEVVQMWDNVWL